MNLIKLQNEIADDEGVKYEIYKCSEGYPPVPDGCVVDKEGYVWSALFGAGCVRRYNPETG